MNKLILIAVLIIAANLESCVRSLYPLTENENELIFKKELLGHWKDSDSTNYIVDTLNEKNGKVYKIAVIDSKKTPENRDFSDTSYFIAALVTIKGKLFLDCTADMDKFANKTLGETAVQSVLPTHYIIRVISIEQNSVELGYIDEDVFSSLVNQKKFAIKNELVNEDDYLITEKTPQLQQKIIELEKFPSSFKNSILTRQK